MNEKQQPQGKLVLFVAGASMSSALAIVNLRKILRRRRPGLAFEIVDVIEQPDRALAASVFFTPTLLFEGGTPKHRLIGDLSSAELLGAFLENGDSPGNRRSMRG